MSPTIDDLPLWDQFLHAAGETAQADAHLEAALRGCHQKMVGWGPAHALAGSRKNVGQLADDISLMLSGAPVVLPEVLEAMKLATRAAKDAADGRQKAVHHRWSVHSDSTDGTPHLMRTTWLPKQARTEVAREDLASVKTWTRQLRKAEIQVRALGWLLPNRDGDYEEHQGPDGFQPGPEVTVWDKALQTARGEFDEFEMDQEGVWSVNLWPLP